MAERKIRLTLSSKLKNGSGAIVDVDFNNENLDMDLEVVNQFGESSMQLEYAVDVLAGNYNLEITYKNDEADEVDGVLVDRNLIIEHIEVANDGVTYEHICFADNVVYMAKVNPNFTGDLENYDPAQVDWINNPPYLLNPNFDESKPRTDIDLAEGGGYLEKGDNPMHDLEEVHRPHVVYTGSTPLVIPVTFS